MKTKPLAKWPLKTPIFIKKPEINTWLPMFTQLMLLLKRLKGMAKMPKQDIYRIYVKPLTLHTHTQRNHNKTKQDLIIQTRKCTYQAIGFLYKHFRISFCIRSSSSHIRPSVRPSVCQSLSSLPATFYLQAGIICRARHDDNCCTNILTFFPHKKNPKFLLTKSVKSITFNRMHKTTKGCVEIDDTTATTPLSLVTEECNRKFY